MEAVVEILWLFAFYFKMKVENSKRYPLQINFNFSISQK